MSETQIKLYRSQLKSGRRINITGSKSESNRALILKALYTKVDLVNLSNAEDTKLLERALTSNAPIIDINHAGTAMRFLTAYYSTRNGKVVELTGSSRMQERPIEVLVEALKHLGADISYLKNTGYPPLRISGVNLSKDKVELDAGISSQYISALLLIAPSLAKGLELKLKGNITSRPYIEMTLSLLRRIGVECGFEENTISVEPLAGLTDTKRLVVESDWSSASYYYSLIALSPLGASVELNYFFKDSLQGDSVLSQLYTCFGVTTRYHGEGIILEKSSKEVQKHVEFDLSDAPDIAQTIAVTCFGLGISCTLKGLHTLKIKETDRLIALETELGKLGASIRVTNEALYLDPSNGMKTQQTIETYHDHRMAMAFAPLSLIGDIYIESPEVVTKSYPDFWRDLKSLDIEMK